MLPASRPGPFPTRRTTWTPISAAELLAAERERIEHHLARLRGDMPSDSLIDDTDAGDQAFGLNERERDAGRIAELEEELGPSRARRYAWPTARTA